MMTLNLVLAVVLLKLDVVPIRIAEKNPAAAVVAVVLRDMVLYQNPVLPVAVIPHPVLAIVAIAGVKMSGMNPNLHHLALVLVLVLLLQKIVIPRLLVPHPDADPILPI